jgi:Protein of unknown function (DUF3040)
MSEFWYPPWFMIPIVAIVAVFATRIVQSIMHARVRELEVRERIAMIERGLVPPPEKDPQGFDRAMGSYRRYRAREDDGDWPRRRPRRYRSAGVTMIGIGLGMMVLTGFTGESFRHALGVGGFMFMLGLAFFVNSWLEREHDRRIDFDQSSPPSSSPHGSQPPSFGGKEPPKS